MSTIIKALEKSKRAQEIKRALSSERKPPTPPPRAPRGRGRFPRWMFIASLVLFLISVGMLAVVYYQGGQVVRSLAQVKTEQAIAAEKRQETETQPLKSLPPREPPTQEVPMVVTVTITPLPRVSHTPQPTPELAMIAPQPVVEGGETPPASQQLTQQVVPIASPTALPPPSPTPIPSPTSGPQFYGAEQLDLNIEGIIWDPEEPYVIINGRILSPGDTADGYLILEIKQYEVKLQRGENTFRVVM